MLGEVGHDALLLRFTIKKRAPEGAVSASSFKRVAPASN